MWKVVLFIIFSSPICSAIDVIGGIKLPYRLTTDKKTPYQRILNKFNKINNLSIKLNVRPIARATQNFLRAKNHCFLPTSLKSMKLFYPEKMKRIKVIHSNSIEIVIATVFSKPGSPPLKSIKELNGKTIANWIGIYADKLLPNIDFKTLKINQDQQSLALLKNNRVDYIIGFLPDTPLVAERSGFKAPVYNKNISLIKTPVHILCHKTPETISFLKKFNLYLKELKASGELQKILGKYSVIAD